jgi:RNA polymerase sigma-70 factor, ECF subfamily
MPAGESEDEVTRLYDRFGASLYRYALMILGRHDAAEDAVQQVFLALIRGGAARLVEPEHYLRRAVRNACYSMLRARAASLEAPCDPDRPLLEPRAGVRAPSSEDRLALERAIAELPAEQREVVHLHAFAGLTFREIADLTGDPANTVASRYRYALDKLRAQLSSQACPGIPDS